MNLSSGNTDGFSKLPALWKTLIVIGFLSVFIIMVLIIAVVALVGTTPKIDITTNLDEYADILEEFDRDTKNDKKQHDDYPVLPKIKDLNGNIMRDLVTIEIL